MPFSQKYAVTYGMGSALSKIVRTLAGMIGSCGILKGESFGTARALDPDPPQLEKPDKGFFDEIVRARCAGRDSDDDRAFG